MLILIITALAAVYIVLGILYESYIHPITILSTIPSAGVGALLALLLTHNELNVIGMIGIILLIGLVKKNAIMMIDVALEVERNEGKKPVEAIYDACILRFRPIMMTTMAALLGGLPLALGSGTGIRTASAARHHDRGRADCEPDADAVYHAGGVCVSGSIQAVPEGRGRSCPAGYVGGTGPTQPGALDAFPATHDTCVGTTSFEKLRIAEERNPTAARGTACPV